MHYEINVSSRIKPSRPYGIPLFAIKPRSITTHLELLTIYKLLRKKFPPEEYYKITVTRREEGGYDITSEIEAECA